MITTTARVIYHNARVTLVEIAPAACVGCVQGCRQKTLARTRVEIPGEYYNGVQLSLSLHNHLALLLHSLLLPLMGFVLGGVAANGMQMVETLVIAGSLAGLILGIILCKAQSHNRFKLIEANS